MRTERFHISGLTCQGCKNIIENELRSEPGIKNICVDLKNNSALAEYDEQVTNLKKIKAAVERLNYKTDIFDETKTGKSGNHWVIFVIIILVFALLYFGVDHFGLFRVIERLNDPAVSYPLIFVIGFIASFHCIGMCGGFIISYSSAAKQTTGRFLPHLAYNIGRLVSYALVGALLGAFGSLIAIGPTVSGGLLLVSACLMAAMGAFFLAGKSLPALPGASAAYRLAARFIPGKKDKPLGPLAIGLLTGFMPCGPLQAMQVYALASGSAGRGALSMAVYVLGTAPLLLAFGALVSWAKNLELKRFFKYSGAIIILLAIVTMNRGLANFGLGFGQSSGNMTGKAPAEDPDVRTVAMDVTYRGFVPNTLYAKKGEKVRWIINGKEVTGCTNEIIMPEYGISQKIAKGVNVIEFTPTKTGEIKFSCWMKMVWGKFIVE